MRVVPPLILTDAMLTSSTAPEPGPGEVAWNGLTNYVVGQTVYLASNHRRYEALTAGADATSPPNNPDKWADIGPTNRWAMFDLLRNTGTVFTGTTATIVITPGQRVDAIGLVGLIADEVTIDISVAAVSVWSVTTTLLTREVLGWRDWLMARFRQKSAVAYFDLPSATSAVITITLTRAAGSPVCGGVILGQAVYLGRTLHNAENDALNFSTIDRDFDGTAVLLQRRSVPKVNFTTRTAKANVPRVLQARDDLNAMPALWSGIDDQDSGYFEPLLILGIYKQLKVTMDQPEEATVVGEIEEV